MSLSSPGGVWDDDHVVRLDTELGEEGDLGEEGEDGGEGDHGAGLHVELLLLAAEEEHAQLAVGELLPGRHNRTT